jgi:hypothetical protein
MAVIHQQKFGLFFLLFTTFKEPKKHTLITVSFLQEWAVNTDKTDIFSRNFTRRHSNL